MTRKSHYKNFAFHVLICAAQEFFSQLSKNKNKNDETAKVIVTTNEFNTPANSFIQNAAINGD